MRNTSQLKKNCVLPRSSKRIENHAVRFYPSAVHELRNPLTNIILSADELVTLVSNNDDVKMYLDIIMRSAVRINKILGMLLKLNVSEAMLREEYSIHQLLEEALEMAGDRIRIKHIAVNIKYETQDCKALINVEEMKMALTNIIINALDAMTMDIGKLRIITKSIADKFIIQIEDNGCGINEENLKNIFKPYFTNKPGGLGIGLAATRSILESNHVRINVKSEVGIGTCFTLLFDKGHQQGA